MRTVKDSSRVPALRSQAIVMLAALLASGLARGQADTTISGELAPVTIDAARAGAGEAAARVAPAVGGFGATPLAETPQSISVIDAETLDELGIALIEAGNPGSNPKDLAFFEAVAAQPLKQARIAAFGATCRPKLAPADDANLQSLLQAGTEVVVIFGKSWNLHVTEVLRTTLAETFGTINAANLRRAHALIESGRARGKVVLEGF